MSNAVNTSVVDLSQNSNTPADQYFNNYFSADATISSGQNDAVMAFFQTLTGGNLQSAQVLASNVIYTAIAQGMDPMGVISQFQGLPSGQLNLYLAMFLNLNRVGTSLVGLNNNQTQNKYIIRAILP
jgi:hypothetical protein